MWHVLQMMHNEENQADRGKQPPNGAPQAPAPLQQQQQEEQYGAGEQQQAPAPPPEHHALEAEGGEGGLQDQQGGWAEGSFGGDASGGAKGKFKPFKFQIHL